MPLIAFVSGFLILYGAIDWSQQHIKHLNLNYLKWALVLLLSVDLLNLVLIGIVTYYWTVAWLLKLDIIEYVEN